MNVFQAFPPTPYTFLVLATGGVKGTSIDSEHSASGVFKDRKGRNVFNQNMETVASDATLHIRADEPFLADVDGNTVGHGVRVTKNGSTQEYRVIGQVEGYNFDSNVLEFYRLTLQVEDTVEGESG